MNVIRKPLKILSRTNTYNIKLIRLILQIGRLDLNWKYSLWFVCLIVNEFFGNLVENGLILMFICNMVNIENIVILYFFIVKILRI